ncbi:hypothetical protein SAMN04488057_102186 [Cyclobacterium lianum]|uniref:Uncharacterized protein n=1 Tax=Cyclobacterium lianum TaxID=388280 RepID=A0A1M7JW51_9BACT|nr:hypothetical protein [Cyclobacterium lianum]SHM57256.1 hypothetical protein SAMN04488057_102186 [Cyclobacterium lianum]
MKFKDLRIWILIFGSMLLIGAYLYQHSKTNQSQLESQGIKAIFLARQNFTDAFYNYHVQLEGYFKRNFYNWGGGQGQEAAAQMVSLIDRAPKFGIEKIENLADAPALEKNIFDPDGVSLARKDSAFLIKVKGFRFFLDEKTKSGELADLDEAALIQNIREVLGHTFPGDTLAGRGFEVDHAVSVYSLMENNIQSFFFDRLFVLDSMGTAIYPGEVAGLPVIQGDSLRGDLNVGERKLTISISGDEYQGFLSPAVIGNQVFYLLGTKEAAQFKSVALRINFKVLSTFLTILLLIFVSIPIISIFNLGDGDVLTKQRVLGLGLSLIIVMVILGFFSFSLVQNYRSDSPADQNVRDLKVSFARQVDSLQANLERFRVHLENGSAGTGGTINALNKQKNVNEFLEFDLSGNIQTMLIPDTSAMDAAIDFGDFPFVSIANRDYVKDLPDTPEKLFISAHFSKSTGNLEGVISRRMDGAGYALTFSLDSLTPKISQNQRFFIFKPDGKVLLKSEKVNIPINYLQEGVGEQKWEEIKTLIANNPGPSDELVWKTPIYVNGHEYEAMLSRIPSGQFVAENWVLYLEDKNLQHTLHSLAALEAITVFVPYLLILVLLAVLTLITNKSSIYLAYEDFSFAWYSPSPTKRTRFVWLNVILFFDLLLFVGVYLFLPLNIFTIYLWSSLFAIQSGTCNFLMLSTTGTGAQKKNINGFLIMATTLWLVLASLLIYLNYLSIDTLYFLLATLVVVLMGSLQVVCHYLCRRGHFPRLAPDMWSVDSALGKIHRRLNDFWNKLTGVHVDKRVYALNFLLWLLIIGFLPGYFIHRQIFNQETYIWDQISIENQQSVSDPDGMQRFFHRLIGTHEEFRRTNFGRFSNQDDELIRDFIAPPHQILVNAFNRPPNFVLSDFFKSGFLIRLIRSNLLLIIPLLLVLIWLFNTIMRLGNKIYLIDYHFTYGLPSLPYGVRKQKHSFVIGVDALRSRVWICREFGLKIADLLLIDAGEEKPEMPDPELPHKGVVLENLHCLGNAEAVLSTILAFRKKYAGKSQYLFVTSGKPLQEILKADTPKQQRLMITEIFSEYLFQYVPLDFQNESFTLPYLGQSWEKLDTNERAQYKIRAESVLFNDPKTLELAAEIAYGPNAHAMAALITEELARDPYHQPLSQERYEKCILSVQRYNKSYFLNIWAELSLKERKMVYNYAREGFINFFNRETMTALIQKGIIKMNAGKDGLVLFSRSFRNFVCLFVSEEDLSRFKQDERKSGNAKMIQAAIFSFVLICIALVSFYDPNILNETSAYISGILGLVGTIYSLLAKGFTKIPNPDNS